MNLTLKQIATLTEAELKGSPDFMPTTLCGLDEVIEGALAYATDFHHPEKLKDLKLGALFVPISMAGKDIGFSGNILYVKNPEWAFTLVMREISTLNKNIKREVHPTAVVDASVKIGQNVAIGALSVIEEGAEIGEGTIIYPQVYVGRNTKIGRGCILYPKVTVREDCILKDGVILQPGAVIGSDGFGYIFINKHEKIPQIGNVILQEDVEIGANTTIDRAKINETVIGANTKIDNLVQIGHNVKVGMSSIIISQTGVAGSTHIGNGVVLAGQTGVSGHLKIGDKVMVGPQAGIISSLESGAKVMGSPAMPYTEYMRLNVIFRKLPEFYKEITALRKKFKI